tara:strand:- start:403 stop:522 length:120 start_codon:yes stop_codon:yes gene_type:complete
VKKTNNLRGWVKGLGLVVKEKFIMCEIFFSATIISAMKR